ncbi:unnamed protein product [Microthlaspi erraticum]|uniref:Uncharacterized protein n=1 Tax=Microthlaspi erraticum TaxID=1685480 RepID=A0A6D2JWB4_9BRAS|nr:unnamed protein product [Microthlaspi erraticum]
MQKSGKGRSVGVKQKEAMKAIQMKRRREKSPPLPRSFPSQTHRDLRCTYLLPLSSITDSSIDWQKK